MARSTTHLLHQRRRRSIPNGIISSPANAIDAAPPADVIVLIVAVEPTAVAPTVSVDASTEQLIYVPAETGAQVSATFPVNPFDGVTNSA
jgi:hypothetical protein